MKAAKINFGGNDVKSISPLREIKIKVSSVVCICDVVLLTLGDVVDCESEPH